MNFISSRHQRLQLNALALATTVVLVVLATETHSFVQLRNLDGNGSQQMPASKANFGDEVESPDNSIHSSTTGNETNGGTEGYWNNVGVEKQRRFPSALFRLKSWPRSEHGAAYSHDIPPYDGSPYNQPESRRYGNHSVDGYGSFQSRIGDEHVPKDKAGSLLEDLGQSAIQARALGQESVDEAGMNRNSGEVPALSLLHTRTKRSKAWVSCVRHPPWCSRQTRLCLCPRRSPWINGYWKKGRSHIRITDSKIMADDSSAVQSAEGIEIGENENKAPEKASTDEMVDFSRVASSSCRCGRLRTKSDCSSPRPNEACPRGKYSFVARITHQVRGFICSGALINSEWVVTSARCMITQNSGDYSISIGHHDVSRMGDMSDVHISRVSMVWVHPGFDRVNSANDLAMIRLATPLNFRATSIRPVCLPIRTASPGPGKILTVVGWGSRSKGDTWPGSVFLREAEVLALSNSRCMTIGGPFANLLPGMTCLLRSRMDSVCAGDVGSPVLAGDGTDVRPLLLNGVVSWGLPNCPTFPTVSTTIPNYLRDVKSVATTGVFCQR